MMHAIAASAKTNQDGNAKDVISKVVPRMALFGALPPSILPHLVAIRDIVDAPKNPDKKLLRVVQYLIQLACGEGSAGTPVPFSPLTGRAAVCCDVGRSGPCTLAVRVQPVHLCCSHACLHCGIQLRVVALICQLAGAAGRGGGSSCQAGACADMRRVCACAPLKRLQRNCPRCVPRMRTNLMRWTPSGLMCGRSRPITTSARRHSARSRRWRVPASPPTQVGSSLTTDPGSLLIH